MSLKIRFSVLVGAIGLTALVGCGEDLPTFGGPGIPKVQAGDQCTTSNDAWGHYYTLACATHEPGEFRIVESNSSPDNGVYIDARGKAFGVIVLYKPLANGSNVYEQFGGNATLRWTKKDGSSGTIRLSNYQHLSLPYDGSLASIGTNDNVVISYNQLEVKEGKIFDTEKTCGPICYFP